MPKHKWALPKEDFKTEIDFSMRKKDGEKIYLMYLENSI